MRVPYRFARSLLMGVSVMVVVSGVWAASEGSIRSARLEVGLRNGTAVSVRNLLTGESYTSPKSDACLAGLYAVAGKTRVVSDSKEVATVSGPASVLQSARWDGTAASWSSSFRFDASGDLVVNQSGKSSAGGVYGISWGIADIPDSLSVLVPGDSGQRLCHDAAAGMRSFDYPYTWECPFVVIQGKSGGLMVYAEDPSFRFKSLFVEHVDGCFRIRFESRNQAPFDGLTSVRSVKWRMRAYKGPWQVAARLYRTCMAAQYRPVPIERKEPKWAKEIRLSVTMGMDVPVLADLAKRVNPRQTLLYIPEWRRDGYDRNYPDYTAVPQFAGFVAAAHKLGFRVMAHVNHFGCDPRSQLYSALSKYHMRDPFTKELQWWETPVDPTVRVAYISPASREWRRIFVAQMKELVSRYGVDALHMDQTLVMINDANGLIDGMNCIQGNLQLHKDLHAVLPQIAMSGEGLNEVTCMYESFAQRHVIGINPWNGSWNDQRLAQAHPISSCVLAPYTTMLGLWPPNPDQNPDTFTAWRRSYERYGVIPTFPRPGSDQLRNPSPLSASVIDEARFFQRYQPVADFDSPWGAGDLYRYRLNDGRRAFYRRDRGVIFGVEDKTGRTELLSRRISGVGRIAVEGSVPGWLAYNEREIIGLDPRRNYVWTRTARDNDAVHISSISSDALVLSEAGVHKEFARFRLDSGSNAIPLWHYEGASSCGVVLTVGGERRHPGIDFTDASGGLIQTDGENLFMHPPWMTAVRTSDASGKAAPVGTTFVEYDLGFPAASRITFSAGVGLRSEAVGKSDGVALTATASAGAAQISASAGNNRLEPRMVSLDLTRFAGKRVKLRLTVDPGPAGDPAYDLGLVSRPIVEMEYERPGAIEIRSPRPLTSVLTADGKAGVVKAGSGAYRLNLSLPNTVTIPFTDPKVVALPCSLMTEPLTTHVLSSGGQESMESGYAAAEVGDAICLNDKRMSLNERPADCGKTLVDYWVTLPDSPARLVTSIGLRDGSKSTGVRFEVRANGRPLFSKTVFADKAWLPVEVDLSGYAGQSMMLTLVADSNGAASDGWASWADPKLVEWSR